MYCCTLIRAYQAKLIRLKLFWIIMLALMNYHATIEILNLQQLANSRVFTIAPNVMVVIV